ncbi:hypothetical protein KI387_024210, partial [Taxus chinensis]
MEEANSEEIESLEKYMGEKDDDEEDESEEDREPLVFSVQGSKEEGREEEHEFLFMWRK